MTEEYTPTKSDGGKPDAFSYEALVNPHDTDVVPGQHEAFGPMGNTSEKTREVVEYDPNTVPVITTEQISAIDDRLNQFFDEEYDYTAPAAETDRMLAEIVDGMLTEAGIDPAIRRPNGSAIVRVRGEDGKEMARAIGLGGRDFGVHDTTIRIVEASHKEDPIEQEAVAEEDKAERVEDAAEDVEEALGQPAIEESVHLEQNNEESNPNQDEENARKERELQEALGEEKKALGNYESTLADIARGVQKIGNPDRLRKGRQELFDTSAKLERVSLAMRETDRLPDKKMMSELLDEVNSLITSMTKELEEAENGLRDAQNRGGVRDEAKNDMMPKLVGDGTKDHVHRLQSGIDTVLSDLESQLKSQKNEVLATNNLLHDVKRYLKTMQYDYHGQGTEIYRHQLDAAIGMLRGLATSRGGRAHHLENVRANATQFENKTTTR